MVHLQRRLTLGTFSHRLCRNTGHREAAITVGARLAGTDPDQRISHRAAEIIDNAADPDVDAKKIHISAEALPDGKPALILQDDGNGLDHEGLHKLLSFGYNDKAERFKGTIGRYGNGFKSGSMRLGKDALVFTRHRHGPTMSVGFLSREPCTSLLCPCPYESVIDASGLRTVTTPCRADPTARGSSSSRARTSTRS